MANVWDYPEEPAVREPVPPRDEDELLQELRDRKLEEAVDKDGQRIIEGDKVRFEGDATTEDYAGRFYPPNGTIGTVTLIDDLGLCVWVQWPKDTTSLDDRWCCPRHCLTKISEEALNG